MTQLELSAVTAVYDHLIKEDGLREWGELDNCLYSLGQLDDEQLYKEVAQQVALHAKTHPKCILDHNHAVGRCMAVATFAAAKAIYREFENGSVFTDGERYILENYLALAHLEKAK